MSYLGDFPLGATFDFTFTSVRFSSGAPFTLAGPPAISAYENNDTTEITAGITTTADYDNRTGLNHCRVVATGANGFESGKSYSLVVTTGTVDSVSAVGYTVARFTIERSAAYGAIGAVSVTLTSPVSSDQDIELVRGDDYSNSDSRALAFSVDGAPDITAATLTFAMRDPSGPFGLQKTGTIVSSGGATQTFRFEFTSSETAAFTVGAPAYAYDVQATLASGRKVTLVRGSVTVLQDYVRS